MIHCSTPIHCISQELNFNNKFLLLTFWVNYVYIFVLHDWFNSYGDVKCEISKKLTFLKGWSWNWDQGYLILFLWYLALFSAHTDLGIFKTSDSIPEYSLPVGPVLIRPIMSGSLPLEALAGFGGCRKGSLHFCRGSNLKSTRKQALLHGHLLPPANLWAAAICSKLE